jgi:capsular polysaccharide biosynthesis protein
MFSRPHHSNETPVAVFITVFFSVFMLVTLTSMVVTFILPSYYAGTARVRIDGDSTTECEIMKSQSVLEPMINKLSLNVEWGKKYNKNGAPFRTEDTLSLLKERLDIHPERAAKFIDVTVYSEDPTEAARIANGVVEAYQNLSVQRRKAVNPLVIVDPPVQIIDKATPGIVPAKPNKQLNIGLGILAGIVLGSIVGGIIARLSSLRNRTAN